MQLEKILSEKIPAVTSEFENNFNNKINSGGCGFYALYLSRALDKLKINHKIVILADEFYINNPVFDLESLLLCQDYRKIPFQHLAVYVNGVLYDSQGAIREQGRYKTKYSYGVISRRDLSIALKNIWNWNPIFNRTQRSIIKRYVNKSIFEERIGS